MSHEKFLEYIINVSKTRCAKLGQMFIRDVQSGEAGEAVEAVPPLPFSLS